MANGLAENKELSKSIEESDIKEVTSKEKNEEVTSDNIIGNSPIDYDEPEKIEGNIFFVKFSSSQGSVRKSQKSMNTICDYFAYLLFVHL